MTTTLAPTPLFRQWDNNGNPLVNGQLFTYAAGTTTQLATYTDSTGATQNSNPVVLNSRGEAPVWLSANVAYKFTLADASGNQLWTVDQIVNSQLITLFGGVDLGSANTYLLSFQSNFQALTNGILVWWIPSNSNTGPSTINVNSLGVIPIVSPNGAALIAGQIVGGQPAQILYYNGNWLLLTGSFVGNTSGVKGYGPTAAGLVDMTPDAGSWVTTFSGPWLAANNPTGTLKWERQGTQVTVWADAGITQAATLSAVITASGLPAEITPSSARNVISAQVSNGAASIINNLGSITINTNNTLTIVPVFTANAGNPTGVNAGGIFNNSGNAGINAGWSITYSL